MMPKGLATHLEALLVLLLQLLERLRPSFGMRRFALCRLRIIPKRCAITSSATEMEEEAGVLITGRPLLLGIGHIDVVQPTPPRPINFSPGQASIRSFRTLVALRTSSTSTFSLFNR
jgi:hypothetical protein